MLIGVFMLVSNISLIEDILQLGIIYALGVAAIALAIM